MHRSTTENNANMITHVIPWICMKIWMLYILQTVWNFSKVYAKLSPPIRWVHMILLKGPPAFCLSPLGHCVGVLLHRSLQKGKHIILQYYRPWAAAGKWVYTSINHGTISNGRKHNKHAKAWTKWSTFCKGHFHMMAHQIETFSALLAICVGNSLVTGEFPAQRPVTRSFDVFFELRLNKRWVNNRETGDLKRNRPHYDVTNELNFRACYRILIQIPLL